MRGIWKFGALALAPVIVEAQVVRPGTMVEVVTAGRTLRGSAVATTPTSIVLADADTVPFASMTSWRTRSTQASKGLKVGVIAGGATFTLLGAALAQGLCESSNCDNAALHGAGIGALFGVVTGGAAGAFIGSLVPRWMEQPTGSTPSVKESPLAALPFRVHLSQGRVHDEGSLTRGGIEYSRNDWRFGLELGTADLGDTGTPTYQSATDPRLRSFTEVIRSTSTRGVTAERRVAGFVWVSGSFEERRRRERTLAHDMGSADDPRYPQFMSSSSVTTDASAGGSIGVVLRHRVLEDIHVRLDARQEIGPWSKRTWSIGVEL